MPKDLFSQQADLYARYRPSYPKELIEYITGFANARNYAWDCATGNGQAAAALAHYFTKVAATDISETQLAHATKMPNIHYQVAAGENTPFAENSFDLITIATAYHWLQWDAFHKEAHRVGKPGAVVAAWAYSRVQSEDEVLDQIIRRFYYDIIYPYWDKERCYVDENYKTVAFEFDPLPPKDFLYKVKWDKDAFKGYLYTWSAVQNYRKQNNASPLALIEKELEDAWKPDELKSFLFPLFMKIGRIVK